MRPVKMFPAWWPKNGPEAAGAILYLRKPGHLMAEQTTKGR